MTKKTSGMPWTERLLGLVGLFLIGLIGFVADHVAAPRERRRAVPRRVPER